VDRVYKDSDRSPQVLRNLQALFGHGRLADTGYVSILPVDQGIEHSGAASFAPNPKYFDPANIVELAIEGGCNAVATTFGALGLVSRKYAEIESRRFTATDIGKIVCRFLTDHFHRYVEYGFTAAMEDELDAVSRTPPRTRRFPDHLNNPAPFRA